MTINTTDITNIDTSNCCACETPIILPVREGDTTISFTLNMPDGTTVKHGIYTTQINDNRGVIELNEPLKIGEVQIQVDDDNCQTVAFASVAKSEFEICKINVIDFQTELINGKSKITSFVVDTPNVLYRLNNSEWSETWDFELEFGISYNIGIKSTDNLSCRMNYPVLMVNKVIPVPYGVPSNTPALLQVPTGVPTTVFTPVSILVPTNVPTPVSVPVGIATPTPVAFIELLPLATPMLTPSVVAVPTTLSVPIPTLTPLCVPSGVPTPVTTPIGVPTPIFCEPYPITEFYLKNGFGITPFPYLPIINATGIFVSLSDAQTAKSQCIAGTLYPTGESDLLGNSLTVGEPFYSTYSPIVSTCGVVLDGFYIVQNVFNDPIVAGTKIIEISAGVIVSINT